MFRKVFKVCFYVMFVLMLIAVITAAVLCFIYGANFRADEYILYGVLTLVGGIILVFVLFAYTGMIIEAADNLAAIRDAVAPKKRGRAGKAQSAPAWQPTAPAQPAPAAPVQPAPAALVQPTVVPTQPQAQQTAAFVSDAVQTAEETVAETVVETEKAAEQ